MCPVIPAEEIKMPRQASRWETFVWPRWLPVRARMPLVAQVTGAVALTALIVGPWWASAPDAMNDTPAPTVPATSVPAAASATAPVAAAAPVDAPPAAVAVAPPKPAAVTAPVRPAHLNLDVRHSFGNVDFSVAVDGKQVLQTKLEGSGKRFGVFGKRGERGHTRSLELTPGVHLVRVRVLSAKDKFDQTRVERFDLDPASVASMRISADRSGLTLVAERPPVVPAPAAEGVAAAPVAPPIVPTAAAPIQAAAMTAAVPQATATASHQDVNAVADLLQSVRSMLIAIAGFVASAATGFVVQEYLRSRRIVFAPAAGAAPVTERRKRRRPGKPAPRYEDDDHDGDDEDDPYLADADHEDHKLTS